MRYNRTTAKDKWTIMMYMRDFDLMATYAYALRSSNRLSDDNIDDILTKMEQDGIYRPRNGGSVFTGQFKSIQIAWYMFGYYNKSRNKNEEKKMVFSPLGNLLLDNLKDKKKAAKIFTCMLFGNGFHQPYSQMSADFNIYAFRLIFQLLRDPRLSCKLYNDEMFYLTMFLKTVDTSTYNELVSDILKLRSQDCKQKLSEFKKNERVIGLACHEWRYAIGMLESACIVNIHEGAEIGKLMYGNISKQTGLPNAVRSYTKGYITLKTELIKFVDIMLENYPYYEKPYPDDILSSKFSSDIVVEMYSFYPPELLDELGINNETDQAVTNMLTIASNVYYYSKEETATGVKFEEALRDAFNLFIDVDAQRLGGAGRSDVECIYHVSPKQDKKFDIEAKSTTGKLPSINIRRLRTHRIQINAQYTLIVTPNYSFGVLKDIENDNSVIVKSATLANCLYQYIAKYGRNISYSFLDDIIESNKGLDITERVNEYVYDNFGHHATDLTVKKPKVQNENTNPPQ